MPSKRQDPTPPLPKDVGVAPGDLQIDPVRRTVHFKQQALPIRGRAFDLLLVLADPPGHYHSPQALMQAVWPGLQVEPGNLRVQVTALRKLLGNEMVINVPGRGYALAAPTLQAARRAGNLPHWTDPLLGRECDVAAVQALVGQHRLVTVLGTGGIGKTRLAQRVALQWGTDQPQGAWWVDLAGIPAGPKAASAVAQAIAIALGVQAATLGDDNAGTHLGRALAGWQCLLVLDNAEYLAGPSGVLPAMLRSLLDAGPGLRLLVTSQQTLGLADEWVYQLDALPLPPPQATPEQMRANPAYQLLERRARATDQRFTVHDDELPAAAAILHGLDGIALAIEMAAARLPLLGVRALQQRLGQRLRLLGQGGPQAAGDQGSTPRHGTLQAALAWSFGLLAPPQKRALLWLSVFAAPFKLEAAQAVLAGQGIDDTEALALIQSLVAKSMLQLHKPPQPEAPQRLRLLESTRLYAAQALDASASTERHQAQRGHLQAMAELARQAKEDFYLRSDATWTARWMGDHEDQMLAFDRAVAHADAPAASEIIELLVLSANITGQITAAVERMPAAMQLAAQAAPLTRARLLSFNVPHSATGMSRYAMAEQRLAAWRAVPAAVGSKGLCTALASMALAHEAAGQPQAANRCLAECLALENPAWPARLRRRCGWIVLSGLALQRDDADLQQQALDLSQRLLKSLDALGATQEALLLRVFTTQALRLQGRTDEALALLAAIRKARMQVGSEIDGGLSLGYTFAALLELSVPASRSPDTLRQARAAAAQSLRKLQAYPAYTRHFLESLAWLACRSGDARMGAMLLAGAARVRQAIQAAPDQLSSRAAAAAQASLLPMLGTPEHARAVAEGQQLQIEDLHQLALNWLSQHEQTAEPDPPLATASRKPARATGRARP